MSVHYQAILWNRQKKIYDSVVAGGIVAYVLCFVAAGLMLHPSATAETLLIRALGTAAFLLLHVILAIGPLTRLDRRFLPLLYNRRHLGVSMFLIALAHGVFSIVQFHALGNVHPLVSLLTSSNGGFPFQQAGFLALIILFLMASTSHDFWLHTLTPKVWKSLHMMVYLAWALLVVHVSFGALQSEHNPLYVGLVGAGATVLIALHLAAALREREPELSADLIDAGEVSAIPESRAVVVSAGEDRIAVFRYQNKVSAFSNVCRHQNGPLGEGKIIDGCVTCPWHGYQYLPENGCSPPPFQDKVSTFRTIIRDGRVFVDPRPLPPGTPVEPARLS